MINEFGKNISDVEIKELSDRILKLSDNLIDELWYRCGLIYSTKDPNFKALNKKQLKELINRKANSDTLDSLLSETPLEEVIRNLEELEK